jgi:PST family polysaccharide transporter
VSDAKSEVPTAGSFVGSAARGSAWAGLQVALGKIIAATATFFLGESLMPEDFGRAWYAVSLGGLLTVVHVSAGSDILLSSPRSLHRLGPRLRSIALGFAVAEGVVALCVAMFAFAFDSRREWLLPLMVIVAIRPAVDAFTIIPLARLRLGFHFLRIASIDLAVTLLGSAGSVLMAWLGYGAMSIVLPTILANGVRAAAYASSAGRIKGIGLSRPRSGWLLRRFIVAGFGSYMTGTLVLIETLVLGLFVSASQLGLFSFAFGLATQVSGTLAFQIAGSLHPVFSHLRNDARRQVEGMMRACRIMCATLVPLLVIQSAIGGAVFRLLWPGKWDHSVPIFAVLTIGQAFIVCQWPAAYVMKAQGRFAGYLKLQLLQALATAAACALLSWKGGGIVLIAAQKAGLTVVPEASTPLAVALGGVLVLACFGPLSVYLAVRSAGVRVRSVLGLVMRPMLISLPFAALALLCSRAIEVRVESRWVAGIWLVFAAGACTLAAVVAALGASRRARSDVSMLLGPVLARTRVALRRAFEVRSAA